MMELDNETCVAGFRLRGELVSGAARKIIPPLSEKFIFYVTIVSNINHICFSELL